MKSIKRAAAVMLMASVLLLSGCEKKNNNVSSVVSGTESQAESFLEKETMTLLYSASDTINPYTAKTDINRQLCKLLYEPLIKLDNEYNLSYSLAESLELKEKNCVVKIKSVLFSDGSRLTADDVVYSFNLAKQSATEYGYKLYTVDSATAADALTVEFKLNKADPYFSNVLDFPIFKKESEKITDSDGVFAPPIGSGRYKLNKDKNALELNTVSVGKNHSVGEIKLINAPDKESLSHYVEIGAADMYYSDISDGSILRMSGERVNININNLIYIGINQNYPLLDQVNLRQAISSGINREVICRDGYYNNAISATGFFNPVWKPVKSVQNIETVANKEITIENLKKIGYNSLDNFGIRQNKNGIKLKLTLLVNKENQLRLSTARIIAKQLSEHGIGITVIERSYEEYIDALKKGQFQLYLGETHITPNMDLSNLILPNGSVAYGVKAPQKKEDKENGKKEENTSSALSGENIEAPKSATAAELVEGFYSGKNNITDLASVLQTEMPFVPICYRTGVLFYNENIGNVKNSSVSDIYFSISDYKFQNK